MPKAKPTVADAASIASQLSAVLKPQPAVAPQPAAKEKVYVSKATWSGTLVVAPGLAFKAKLYKATNDPTEASSPTWYTSVPALTAPRSTRS
jgi:hypothetical protein